MAQDSKVNSALLAQVDRALLNGPLGWLFQPANLPHPVNPGFATGGAVSVPACAGHAIVSAAGGFATHAHAGQTRKYTGEPYIAHPASVAALVAGRPHTAEMLAAAWLHDVVEDTPVTIDDIRDRFGAVVSDMVWAMTDPPGGGNRAARKARDRARLAGSSPAVQTIKLADLIDNSRTILAHDPKFAAVYIAEMRELLAVLDKGDAQLHRRAMALTRGEAYNRG